MTVEDISHPYRAPRVSMGTCHHKGRIVSPPLAALEFDIVEVAIDTDAFGTFSGERPRALSPIQAAVARAHAAIEVTGDALGLGSEGTFGPDPMVPWVAINTEILSLVDAERGIEFSVQVREPNPVHHAITVGPTDPLEEFLTRARFPTHALMVRPAGVTPAELSGSVTKGITTVDHLAHSLAQAWTQSPQERAVIENDLRAHCNPTRQRVIAKAAARLAERVAQLCPACATPGWGAVDRHLGLPCAACGSRETTAVRAYVSGCVHCSQTHEQPVPETTAVPARCHRCNP